MRFVQRIGAGLRPVAVRARHRAAQHLGVIGSVVGVSGSTDRLILTYDDGPRPGSTDAILNVLARHGATATFFMLGTRARTSPSLVRDVVAAGHEVALHGLDHRRATGFSARQHAARLRSGRALLEDIGGQAVRWYRPPYGAQTPITWAATRSVGLHTVMWSATTWDWRDVPQEERVRKALSGAKPGAILLAHDSHAGRADLCDDGPEPTMDRADLAERLVGELSARGLRASSLGDALGVGGRPTREPRFVR